MRPSSISTHSNTLYSLCFTNLLISLFTLKSLPKSQPEFNRLVVVTSTFELLATSIASYNRTQATISTSGATPRGGIQSIVTTTFKDITKDFLGT